MYLAKNYYVLIPFTILAIILFVLELTSQKKIYELFNYFIFTIPYFFSTENTFHLLLAVLIFGYGFPLGTLLKKFIENA